MGAVIDVPQQFRQEVCAVRRAVLKMMVGIDDWKVRLEHCFVVTRQPCVVDKVMRRHAAATHAYHARFSLSARSVVTSMIEAAAAARPMSTLDAGICASWKYLECKFNCSVPGWRHARHLSVQRTWQSPLLQIPENPSKSNAAQAEYTCRNAWRKRCMLASLPMVTRSMLLSGGAHHRFDR